QLMARALKLFVPGALALLIGAYLGLPRGHFNLTTPPAHISDFSLPDVMGQAQSGGQWLGKVVVVNHWASWCPPCVKEIPLLIDMQDRYRKQGLQIVGIAHDKAEAARIFGDQVGINYPSLILTTGGSELMISQGNEQGSALPFTAFFDREGKLKNTKLGILESDELSKIVESLL
ncbi:MAG: TlpA family protein disulfide reductase, partial [bacterium]